jgi:hypothetical protein
MLACYRKPRLLARGFPAFGFQTFSQRQTHQTTAQATVIHLSSRAALSNASCISVNGTRRSENGTRKNWGPDRVMETKFDGNANKHLASDFFASVCVMHNSTKAAVRRQAE